MDAVVTDPPFFDNVHYSQLADFFYVWQRYLLGANDLHNGVSTRSPAEVQQTDPTVFTERLSSVWTECHRVLRPDGLLVFTYHHSRAEGWRCILESLVRARFAIVAAHPIKAEMSVAAPKQQAKEPIDLDVILVCRKRVDAEHRELALLTVLDEGRRAAMEQVARFNKVGRNLGRNDVRVIFMAQVVRSLSLHSPFAEALQWLDSSAASIEMAINQIHRAQDVAVRAPQTEGTQLGLW